MASPSRPKRKSDSRPPPRPGRRIVVTYRPIADLRLDERNPRAHSARQIRQLADSIETFGFIALSVALAPSQAVLPKDEYLRGTGVSLPWPVSGLPARLHLDNAKEFRSQALRQGVAQYGIEVVYRPPATPHWGGHIERLIGTTMGAFASPLPSTAATARR